MKILLIDQQFLTAQGISTLLNNKGYAVSCFPYHKAAGISKLIRLQQPDLLIIDPLSIKGELHEPILTALNNHIDKLPIIALTNSSRFQTLHKLLATGIRCHLSKQASGDEILQGITAALKQETFYCQRTQDILGKETALAVAADLLSDREKEIILLIADGKTNKDISDAFFLSYHTVRTHRKNITRKLGFSLKNAPELARLANALR
jgi:two-component system NarL family response regulator